MNRLARALIVVAATVACVQGRVWAQQDSGDYLTLNAGISDTGLEPAALFVPAGRPVQLMLRNRGTQEHHFRVVAMVPDDVRWIAQASPAPDADDDDHSNHHNRQFVRTRAASPGGIVPTGKDVHAYVAVPGDIDIVLFSTSQIGKFAVHCDLHDEQIGTLEVFDDAGRGAEISASPTRRSTLARVLTRNLGMVSDVSATGVEVEATYATPEFVAQSLGGAAAMASLQPDRHIAFLLTERIHTSNLPTAPVTPSLLVDGRAVRPVDSKVVTDSVHHRATVYRFERDAAFGQGHQVMTLRLPTGPQATWHLPLVVPNASAASSGPLGFGEQWGLVLALLGGMVAAMWPCLFQLTVYFIPALAGVAMQEARDPSHPGRQRQVLSAAFYFILGFTVVYTVTGALIGLATQQFGGSAQFEAWQRYVSVAAGVIVIGLSLRVAAKARAPLVCRMPLLSHLSRSKRPATRLEMMLAGLAFATGCMTCFGSALVVGMVVYVGLAQSALYGALVLFLFSLGMAIPLVLAAVAMARALPLLMKLERAVPWMGLGSAALMAGFGVLLISGNYMLVSEWTFRAVNGAPSATAPWNPPMSGTVRKLPPVAASAGQNMNDLQVAVAGESLVLAWMEESTRTIRATESRDRGRHFSPARVVGKLDDRSPVSGHLQLAAWAETQDGVGGALGFEPALTTRVTWTTAAGVAQAWQSRGDSGFEPAGDARSAVVADAWSAVSVGVNTVDPWRTMLIPQGPRLMVAGLVDAFDRPVAAQLVEGPSPLDTLAYIGVDSEGNPFGIWMAPDGILRMQRHPNPDSQTTIGVDLPLVLAKNVSGSVRAAAVATEWGVVVAWVDSTSGSIALREVAFDQLCAPLQAGVPDATPNS